MKTVDLLLPHQSIWERGDLIGGSHAQKDLLSLLLIQSAIRSKQIKLAEKLLDEKTLRSSQYYQESADSNLIDRLKETL